MKLLRKIKISLLNYKPLESTNNFFQMKENLIKKTKFLKIKIIINLLNSLIIILTPLILIEGKLFFSF
jgi:predicted thioredoxin/glutaredoxin